MNRRGITLNELLIALGIAATVGILASRQMISATRFSASAIEQSQMEMDKVSLAREIERAFSRAILVGVSQGAVGGATGFPVGYKLDVGQQTGPAPTFNEGTVTFFTDMRPCPTAALAGAAIPPAFLDPANALNPVAFPAASQTLVSFHCCTAGNGNIQARNPATGGVYNFLGACTKGRGLTVNYITGVTAGNLGISKCYGNWGVARDANRAANVNEVGNSIRGMRLAVTGSNPNSCRNQAIEIRPNGLESTALTPNSPNTFTFRPQNCGSSLLFYFALLSREATHSGEAVNDRIGSQDQADRTAGPDMSAYSEFYGVLGLAGSPRVIDCVTGALDL